MKRSPLLWLSIIFAGVLLLAGLSSNAQPGWAHTVPPTVTPEPSLPAVHPLYGDCEEEGDDNGTVPAPTPAFEPFLPNSIYVDWCGHALLTIALPGEPASAAQAADQLFDPAVGHRIGFFYTTSAEETGWSIARYSYRVDLDGFEDLYERQLALLRELCPLGNVCNQLLIAQVDREGATFHLLDAAGVHTFDQLENKTFMPFVNNQN